VVKTKSSFSQRKELEHLPQCRQASACNGQRVWAGVQQAGQEQAEQQPLMLRAWLTAQPAACGSTCFTNTRSPHLFSNLNTVQNRKITETATLWVSKMNMN